MTFTKVPTESARTISKNPRLLPLSCIVVMALLSLGATSTTAQTSHSDHSSSASQGKETGYQVEMHAQMAKMNEDMTSASMSGNPDLDFAMMMIPHHQGAIDMAKTELKYGKDAKLREMAEKIIETQEQEIKELRERIKVLQNSPGSN